MRTTTLGNKEIQLRAAPLALLFYRQAFDRDLVADIIQLQSLKDLAKGDFSKLDTVGLLKIAYAMHRASDPKAVSASFEEWLAGFDSIAFDDPQWIIAITEEAMEGFFRTSTPAPPAKKPKAK